MHSVLEGEVIPQDPYEVLCQIATLILECRTASHVLMKITGAESDNNSSKPVKPYAEGPHCPLMKKSKSIDIVAHKCSENNALCIRHNNLKQHLRQALTTITIEASIGPDCLCGELRSQSTLVSAPLEPSDVLLEQWTITLHHKLSHEQSHMPLVSLYQAVRSYLHFSQLSAWYMIHNGLKPSHVIYRIIVPGEDITPFTNQQVNCHEFPVAGVDKDNLIQICVKMLPRMNAIPSAKCSQHSSQDVGLSTPSLHDRPPTNLPLKFHGKNTKMISECAARGKRRSTFTREGGCEDYRKHFLDQPTESYCFPLDKDLPQSSQSSLQYNVSGTSYQSSGYKTKYFTKYTGTSGYHKNIYTHQHTGLDLFTSSPAARYLAYKTKYTKEEGNVIVDDRMQITCLMSGKHHCNSECEEELDLKCDYTFVDKPRRRRSLSKVKYNESDPPQGERVLHGKFKEIDDTCDDAMVTNASLHVLDVKCNPSVDVDVDVQTNVQNNIALQDTNNEGVDDGETKRVETRDTKEYICPFLQVFIVLCDRNHCVECYKERMCSNNQTDKEICDIDVDVNQQQNSRSSQVEICDNNSSVTVTYTDATETAATDTTDTDTTVSDGDTTHYHTQTNKYKNKKSKAVCNLKDINNDQFYFKSDIVTEKSKELKPLFDKNDLNTETRQASQAASSLTDDCCSNVQNITSQTSNVVKCIPIPTAEEKLKFRRSLDTAAQLVFHRCSGLPLTSSPAPVRRINNSFTFDSSLNSVSAIKSALCEASASVSSEDENESEGSLRSPASPGAWPVTLRTTKYYHTLTARPLLGSFEESVLNGRLDPVSTVHGFTTELGASGSFCPRHVHLPVAVFFYTLDDRDIISVPYLGHINLGKKGYNVPRVGTVQVTLFNPLRTVVKMFVVPYDLHDMPPNTHTFLRQRTFCVPSGCNDKYEGEAIEQDSDNKHKYLRYLIHLKFATSKSGRTYLHTDIRMIIFRKTDMDTASALGTHCEEESYELRSQIDGPINPKFSPRK